MKSAPILKPMSKIDAHSLRIKMMASYLHYLLTNRCAKALIFDAIQNLNFPPKTKKSILMTSQHFFFDFITENLVQWLGPWPVTQEIGVQFQVEATFSAIFFFKIFFCAYRINYIVLFDDIRQDLQKEFEYNSYFLSYLLNLIQIVCHSVIS